LTQITLGARVLKEGGTVVFPTETVYGLGASALDPLAVAKIYEIKGRPLDHPLIVHVENLDRARDLVTEMPELAERLALALWPGPLTLVLPKRDRVPDLVTAGMATVAVRVPRHPVARKLLELFGGPVAAPSANLFGRISPTTSDHVLDLRDKVTMVLAGGDCEVGLESTIVSFVSGEPLLLRPGGISREELESIVGKVALPGPETKVVAPGMLPRHYAPATPVVLCEMGDKLPEGNLGLLCGVAPESRTNFKVVIELSPSGNLRQAAARLFSAMRELDAAKLDFIVAYRFPEFGLGVAINDRLKRASA
jgi:L-threonylcarbamoyladenylate synthase